MSHTEIDTAEERTVATGYPREHWYAAQSPPSA